MRVLLINTLPDFVKQRVTVPLGLLSIATYLSKNGHTVKVFDRTVRSVGLQKHLRTFRPDIVGLSVISSKSYSDARKISIVIKKRGIPVVVGGIAPSLNPEVMLGSAVADYVVIGEGEITLLALLEALTANKPLRGIEGLAFRENGEVVVNKERKPADLADLPVTDFRFVNPRDYFVSSSGGNLTRDKMLHVYSSKGCVYRCAYCYNTCFENNGWRARPPEYFLREIKCLIEDYGADSIFFADDLMIPSREYADYICGKIKESGMAFLWGCDVRADMCTKEMLDTMYDAGCRWLFVGIESGSERMQRMINKKKNLRKAKETIDYCKEIGIATTTSFMIGLPDETEDDLRDTVRFAQKLNSDIKVLFYFGPVPKSELHNRLAESGRLKPAKSFRDWSRLKFFDTIGPNYTKVTDKELKVINSVCFMSMVQIGYNPKMFFRQAWYILKRFSLKSVLLEFKLACELLSMIWYASAYPGIRSKYGFERNLFEFLFGAKQNKERAEKQENGSPQGYQQPEMQSAERRF